MMDKRWSQFKVTADTTIPVRQAYEAWATGTGLESWLLSKASFYTRSGRKREAGELLSKGDSYAWHWHGWPKGEGHKGIVLETNGTDFLQFTFAGDCIVSVFISRQKNVTLIDVVQENIPLEEDPARSLYVDCQTGWLFHLANLKSVYQGGIDLRNKRDDVKSSFK